MENNQLRERIEEYFATLEAPLAELPTKRREEFVTETRAHLNAMVEAKRADGLSEEAAWKSAMDEFGEPGEVGRALWKQWATSGQLESEGEPIPTRELAKKFVWPLVAVLVCYPVLLLLLSFDSVLKVPIFLTAGFSLTGFGVFRARRAEMQWTPSNIIGAVLGVIQLMYCAAQLQWGESRYGTMLFRWGMPLLLACWMFQWWLSRRERANRPWRLSSLYAQNPVVAEQTYRISPLIGWTMGSLMGCIGTLTTGMKFFGLSHALLGCALWIMFSAAVGFWLYRRK